MSDDNILRVGASVDLAGFQSGLPAAASLVEQNTRRMVDSFVKVLTGSTQASKQVLVDWAGRPFQPAADSADVMRQSVDISAESIKALSDAMHGVKQDTEQTASGFEGFANKVEGFITHPLDAAGGFAKKLLMDLGPVGTVAIGAAAGLAELGKQAFDLVNSEGAAARQTQNLATQLGLSYEQAKKLGEMARLVDMDIGGLVRVSMRLADALEHGGKEYDAMKKLGVNATEAGPALLQTLEKLSRIENVTERMAAAAEVLGKRQAMRLLPLIADYEKLGDLIEGLGGKLDEEHVQGLLKAHQQVELLHVAWDHLKEAMAARLEPAVTVIITAINKALGDNAPTGPEKVPGERKVAQARADLADAQRGGKNSVLSSFAESTVRTAQQVNAATQLWSASTSLAATTVKDATGASATLVSAMAKGAMPGATPSATPGTGVVAQSAAIKQATENLQKALAEQAALVKKGVDDQAAAVTKAASDKTYDAAFAHSIETLKKKLEEVHETVGKTEREKDLPGHTKALKEEEALKRQIKAAEKALSGQATAEQAAIAEKKIENEKKLGLDGLALYEQTAKQKLHLGEMTIEQETAALQSAENARYAIEVDAAQKIDAWKAKVAAKEHKPAPVGTSFEGLAADHQKRSASIANQGANAADSRDDTTARDQVRDTQIVAQARVEAEAHASKAALAARHASIDEQTQAERDGATDLHTVKLNALNADLALAKEDPLKNKDKIDTLNAQIEAAAIQHETKLADITADGVKRKRDEEIAYDTAVANASIASATRVYDSNKARIEEQFKNHEIDARERIKLLREIEEQEYKTQLAAAEGERDTAVEKHGGRTDNADVVNAEAKIEALRDKTRGVMAGLDQEVRKITATGKAVALQYVSDVSEAFQRGFGSWLSGQKRFAAAMIQSFRQMADSFIMNLIKMNAQRLISDAINKTSSEKEALVDAKVAAIAAYRSVMAAVPFPANVIVAPIAAAAVFAGALSFASFEHGGVVPTTGVKFLHEGERVLTPRDNASFEKAIEVGAAVGGMGGPGAAGGPGAPGASGGAGSPGGAAKVYQISDARTWQNVTGGPQTTQVAAASPGTFERGSIVPKTQMSLHERERERASTENQASRQSAMATNDPGGGHTVNWNYHAAPGESPDSVVRNTQAYKRAMRDGKLRFG